MRGLISWFVDNPIASKLLMILIVTLGLLSFPLLDKEFFPQTKIDLIRVSVAYPGASPAQVEQQICARIEESVRQLAAIEEIRSIAREGFGEVVIEVETGGVRSACSMMSRPLSTPSTLSPLNPSGRRLSSSAGRTPLCVCSWPARSMSAR